jgi:hypothetical protein
MAETTATQHRDPVTLPDEATFLMLIAATAKDRSAGSCRSRSARARRVAVAGDVSSHAALARQWPDSSNWPKSRPSEEPLLSMVSHELRTPLILWRDSE